MTTHRLLSLCAVTLSAAVHIACGSETKARPDPNVAELPQGPRHDYTSTWVYAVGEVEAPTAKDCRKALGLAEAESDCVGSVCKFGVHLLKDFEAVCMKNSSQAERAKARDLHSRLASRASASPTECGKQADEWLQNGCGKDGACEPQVRQWATRCFDEIKSPLAKQLLERLVENSLNDPRRVKFDVAACDEAKKKLAEASKCTTAFECDDAQKWIERYGEACSEGNNTGIPLEQAMQVMRIRYGANKPTDPISIAESKAKVVSQPGLLALANGSGAIVHVCDEPVTDVRHYVEQRKRCENGMITAFLSVRSGDGTNLEVRHLRHESDSAFMAAHPDLSVQGETQARSR